MTWVDGTWLALGLAVLGFELRGVVYNTLAHMRRIKARPGEGDRDTISEYVWDVRSFKIGRVPVGWMSLAGFFGWLIYHLFVQG